MRRNQVIVAVALVVVVLVVLALFMHIFPFSGDGSGSPAPGTGTGYPSTGTSNPSSTTPSIRLRSLNGTLNCLGGDEITEQLWMKMRDYNASSPEVSVYVEWLRYALADKPVYALTADPSPEVESRSGVGHVVDDLGYEYWWVDAYGWKAEPPSMDGVVRIGVIKLGFGTGVIVTAYQVGDHVDVVVHGTVLNATEYRETAMVRALAIGGCSTSDIPSTVLYRIVLRGHGSYLKAGNESLPIRNVYVLLEIPIAIKPVEPSRLESSFTEYVGWMVIGRPALGLAIHLAYPPTADPLTLYKQLVVQLTVDIVTNGDYYIFTPAEVGDVTYVENYGTPLTLRNTGGLCKDHAPTTAYFASTALGATAAVFGGTGHGMSLLVLPSSVFGAVETSAPDVEGLPGRGPINTHHDIDGDNVPEAGIVLSNTAPEGYTLKRMDTILSKTRVYNITSYRSVLYNFIPLEGDTMEPALLECDSLGQFCHLTWGGWLYLMGFTVYVRSLPDWLTPPWYPVLEEKVYGEMVEEPAPDKLRYIVAEFSSSIADAEVCINTTMKAENLTAPSYRLAMRNVLNKIPLINVNISTPDILLPKLLGGGTNPLINLVVFATWDGSGYRGTTAVNGTPVVVLVWETGGEWVVAVWVGNESAYSGPVGWSLPDSFTVQFAYNGAFYRITVHIVKESNGGGSSTETSIINATVVLSPVYTNAPTPWGPMPMLDKLIGTAIVNSTNITVEAFYGGDGYDVYIYVNDSYAYGTHTGLPATIEFEYDSIKYRVTVEPPAPPTLNETITLSLEPVDQIPVILPNGTEINITIYEVNQTIRIGNTTIAVVGYVSRLGVDLDVWVFGVPPAKYNVSIEGLDALTSIDYAGALHIYIHYQAPENQLIPQDTAIKINVDYLNLILMAVINQ